MLHFLTNSNKCKVFWAFFQQFFWTDFSFARILGIYAKTLSNYLSKLMETIANTEATWTLFSMNGTITPSNKIWAQDINFYTLHHTFDQNSLLQSHVPGKLECFRLFTKYEYNMNDNLRRPGYHPPLILRKHPYFTTLLIWSLRVQQ